jgi:hypothetical protein
LKFYASEVLSALTLYLFLYVVLVFLLVSFESAALWYLIWIAATGGSTVLAVAVANQGQDTNRPSTYFGIAVAAVLTLGCLTLSAQARSTVGIYAMLAGTAMLGVPLGIGAVRLLRGPWQPVTLKAIAVGALAGILGVVICLPLTYHLADFGVKSFIALPTIPVVNLFGFDVFPGWQSGTVVRRTVLGEPLGALKLPGMFFFLALLFQGLQSILAALWDTLILGVCALATSWAGTRLLLGRS